MTKPLKLHIEDMGQDFTWFIVHGTLIVDAGPFQSWVWKGRNLTISEFKAGDALVFAADNSMLNYRVETVEELEPFRPSNATVGDTFLADFCNKCRKDGEDAPCDILTRTLVHDITDPEYPEEWVSDGEGYAWCVAFDEKQTVEG